MPLELVVVSLLAAVPCWVILTAALGSTAPVLSVTVPVSVPRLVWPTRLAVRSERKVKSVQRENLGEFISVPPRNDASLAASWQGSENANLAHSCVFVACNCCQTSPSPRFANRFLS